MAIAVYFHPDSMSAQQYDEIMRRLEAADAGKPAGRLHHSSFGPEERLPIQQPMGFSRQMATTSVAGYRENWRFGRDAMLVPAPQARRGVSLRLK